MLMNNFSASSSGAKSPGSSDWLHQSLLIGSRCTFPLIHCLKGILMKDQDDNQEKDQDDNHEKDQDDNQEKDQDEIHEKDHNDNHEKDHNDNQEKDLDDRHDD